MRKAALIIAALFVAYLVYGSYPRSEEDELINKAQAEVAGKLKDPDTAKFTNVRAGAKHVVCGNVNGKNSYGAYAGAERFVYIDVTVSDIMAGEDGAILESQGSARAINGEGLPFSDVYKKYGC